MLKNQLERENSNTLKKKKDIASNSNKLDVNQAVHKATACLSPHVSQPKQIWNTSSAIATDPQKSGNLKLTTRKTDTKWIRKFQKKIGS